MKPKNVLKIFWTVFLFAVAICVIGILSDRNFLGVIGVIVVICDFIFHRIFYRCPHCERFLDRSTGDYCPYCGKEINR